MIAAGEEFVFFRDLAPEGLSILQYRVLYPCTYGKHYVQSDRLQKDRVMQLLRRWWRDRGGIERWEVEWEVIKIYDIHI